MVGYTKGETDSGLSAQDYMLAGAFSGLATRLVSQPLDVVKTRFQLQVEPVWGGNEGSKYRSNLQAGVTILKEEGIRGLWKGHNPGQLLSITYGMGQFGSFEMLTWVCHEKLGLHKSSQLHFICGSLSGVVGTLISYPFDIIRTRFIAQGNNLYYRSMSGGIRLMLKNEGPRSLYKGLTPTLLQVAPHAGAQFAFYNISSSLFGQLSMLRGEGNKLNWWGSLISGSVSGLMAKTLVYPFDLTRKRMEFQGFQKARTGYGKNFVCEGMIHCVVKTFSNEGIPGLFKGLSPSLVKAMVSSALHFSIYEQTVQFISTVRSPVTPV